jgi:uncharacterized membrane protein YtjA (UPF0391 family)
MRVVPGERRRAMTVTASIGTSVASLLVPLQTFGGGGFLQYALVFFVLAVVAGLAGFRGVAGLTMEIAKILVLVFLVLAVVSLLL